MLWRSPGLMAALVLGFLAIKALVIYTLARMIGLPYQDRAVFTMWWRGRAQGNFLWHLAESAANQTQIGLVGLAATGLEFGP